MNPFLNLTEKTKRNKNSHSTCSTNARNTSLVMQGRLSLHNSTKEVERDVVDISKRLIVSGLATKSKCPWRQPKKRGSRQVNDLKPSRVFSLNFMVLVLV